MHFTNIFKIDVLVKGKAQAASITSSSNLPEHIEAINIFRYMVIYTK